MADYSCTITGIERQVRRGTLRLLRRVNVRPTLELEIQSLDGSYIPAEGAPIVLSENAAPLFGGRVQHPSTGGLDGEPVEELATRIDCVDHAALADDLYLHTNFPGGTVKAFLQWVITNYLGAKGTTLDPGQVDGPPIPTLPYTYRSQKRVSDGLTDACKMAVGWTWTISAANVLSATPPGATLAPFDIVDGDPRVIGDVRLDETSEQYGNRVIVLGNASVILYGKDDFTAETNGTKTVFTLKRTPTGDYPHLPNAGVVYVIADAGYEVAETFGLGSATWIYDPDANTITDTGATWPGGVAVPGGVTAYRAFPLPLHRPMWIIYDGAPLAIAIAEDTTQQGPPRGVVEKIVTSDLSDQAALDAQAQAELIKALATPQTVVYETDELGLAPGQLQAIDQPLRGISGQFLIQQVETRDIENVDDDDTPLLRHTVTAIEYLNGSTAYPGRVGDLYTLWAANPSGGAPAVSAGAGLTIPGLPRQMFFNDGGFLGAAPDALYDKNGTGDRYGIDNAPARLAAVTDDDGLGVAFNYSASAELAYPPAAPGVAITPSGSAWGNSAWVPIVAATPQAWTLGHLAYMAGAAAEYEFDVGVGAAGAEVVVATLGGYSGDPSFTGFEILRFPVPYGPIAAGSRIAVRLRIGQPGGTAWRVGLNYWPDPPGGAVSRSTVAPVMFPPAASGVHVTPVGTAWASGPYTTLIAATSGVLTVAYLTAWPGSFGAAAYEIDIATGAAGAEVVVATVRGDTEASFFGMGPVVMALWPFRTIPAGVRVALRIRKGGTNTSDWWIKLGGYLGLDRPELLTATAQVARPAGADSLTLTSGATAGTPGAWVVFDPALAAAFAVCAIVPTGAPGYQIDVDIGYGTAGAEVLATTFRASGDSGNGSAIVLLSYACAIPAGARLVARAVGLDGASVSRTVAIAIVGVPAPDFTLVSTDAQQVWPHRLGGIGNPQVASSWTNSAYAALVADSGATARVITGLAIYAGFGDESELDLAFGAGGAEVVATTVRLSGEGNATSHHPYIRLDAPLLVPAHSRVSYRTRRNGNTTTQSWTVAVTHAPAVTASGSGAKVQLAIGNRTAGRAKALTVLQTNAGENDVKASGPIHVTAPAVDINGAPIVTAAAALPADQLLLGAGAAGVKALGAAGIATQVLHGNAAGPPTFGPVTLTADVAGRLPYANLTAATAINRLLGRGDSGVGDWQEIALGSGLAMTGTTLSATGGGASTHYDTPLTDGDPFAADLIFAAGECIIVQVPV